MTTPALDQPVTQTIGTNANGCTTDTITCNNPNAAGQVIFQFFNNGVDMGTDSGTGTVTDTLVCNAQGQLVLTLNGASSVVTDVECLAA
uniref:C6 domain-containing protein n=1 Tax=Acrobeloides nanus TaxID=290746 RepID=A0A914DLA5_9BILA